MAKWNRSRTKRNGSFSGYGTVRRFSINVSANIGDPVGGGRSVACLGDGLQMTDITPIVDARMPVPQSRHGSRRRGFETEIPNGHCRDSFAISACFFTSVYSFCFFRIFLIFRGWVSGGFQGIRDCGWMDGRRFRLSTDWVVW